MKVLKRLNKIKINRELLPTRCEICHQVDLFDNLSNECFRCKDVFDKQIDISELKIVQPTYYEKLLTLTVTNKLFIEKLVLYFKLLATVITCGLLISNYSTIFPFIKNTVFFISVLIFMFPIILAMFVLFLIENIWITFIVLSLAIFLIFIALKFLKKEKFMEFNFRWGLSNLFHKTTY